MTIRCNFYCSCSFCFQTPFSAWARCFLLPCLLCPGTTLLSLYSQVSHLGKWRLSVHHSFLKSLPATFCGPPQSNCGAPGDTSGFGVGQLFSYYYCMHVFGSLGLWGLLGLLWGLAVEMYTPSPTIRPRVVPGWVWGRLSGTPSLLDVSKGAHNSILRHITWVWVITFWLFYCLLEASWSRLEEWLHFFFFFGRKGKSLPFIFHPPSPFNHASQNIYLAFGHTQSSDRHWIK